VTAHAQAALRPRRFDPDRSAYFEKAGWQAYYDRRWLRVLRLTVQVNREQFAMSQSTAAAEMDYWVVHRRLAIVRRDAPDHRGDNGPMMDSLARPHGALFSAPPEAIRCSAEL
jgi:hypothetical protein